tara:strand:- start:366 stop:548 length:183 start_codon:yes stop_codon:yes gene_type:complete
MPKNKSKQFSNYNWYELLDGTRFKARDRKDAIEYAIRLNTFSTPRKVEGVDYNGDIDETL